MSVQLFPGLLLQLKKNCAGARKKVIIWHVKEMEVKKEKAERKVSVNKVMLS